jgi:hypothetical protein
MAGDSTTGRAGSQARQTHVRQLSHKAGYQLRQRIGVQRRDEKQFGPAPQLDVQHFVATVVA